MRAIEDGRPSTRRNARLLLMLLTLFIVGVVWWLIRDRGWGSFHGGESTGRVEHEELAEISGIAVSRKNRGVIWAHNDSGGSARIFAMKTDGSHLGTFVLTGARSIDYEDMALGPGPDPTIDYLYVADTGNNDLDRATVTVYRVPEPSLNVDGPPVTRRLSGVEALPMSFPGRPQECETLLVDPLSGDLYLISRDRRSSGRGGYSLVFRNAAPQETGVKITLELVARFSAPTAIKGGDISPDGKTILLRAHSTNGHSSALRWTWERKKSLAEIFRSPGMKIPTAFERQGEAIAFSADGLSYYTIGEGLHARIYRYDDIGSNPDGAGAKSAR